MKVLLSVVILSCVAAISGCSKEETRTVEWYMQNRADVSKVLAECNNNPGEKANTPNCINAKEADKKITALKKLILQVASSGKVAVVEYYSAHDGKWPENNAKAGLAAPEAYASKGVESVTIQGNSIRVVLTDPITSDTENNDVIFVATPLENISIQWSCQGGKLPNELRPDECVVKAD